MAKVKYDCSKCPGYCCSYPNITLQKTDVERLAAHFGLSFADAERKFTRAAHGEKWTMRRKKDIHYGRTCRFFDIEKRNCSVYLARPDICRGYPPGKRCGYYEFLKFERKHQQDDTFVPTTDSSDWP